MEFNITKVWTPLPSRNKSVYDVQFGPCVYSGVQFVCAVIVQLRWWQWFSSEPLVLLVLRYQCHLLSCLCDLLHVLLRLMDGCWYLCGPPQVFLLIAYVRIGSSYGGQDLQSRLHETLSIVLEQGFKGNFMVKTYQIGKKCCTFPSYSLRNHHSKVVTYKWIEETLYKPKQQLKSNYSHFFNGLGETCRTYKKGSIHIWHIFLSQHYLKQVELVVQNNMCHHKNSIFRYKYPIKYST